jgi:hypothetical protein
MFWGMIGAVAVFAAGMSTALSADQQMAPVADGTLVDGGPYGPADGNADLADWSFNQSSFEGLISLARTAPPIEHRVIWEFNLANVTAAPPVTATLTFRLRGDTRFPAEPAAVCIYSYPADGLESLLDFGRGPATLTGSISLQPLHPATQYRINVNDAVNGALGMSSRKIGLRFQIDPATPAASSQVFMDVLESDPATKPVLTIASRVPGDFDSDGDVDLVDYRGAAECLAGPGTPVLHACLVFDADRDGDVDLRDGNAFFIDAAQY